MRYPGLGTLKRRGTPADCPFTNITQTCAEGGLWLVLSCVFDGEISGFIRLLEAVFGI